MSFLLFLLAFEKTPFHDQNTPGQQAVVLVRAFNCSVELLLEVKEARALILADTILPNPAQESSLLTSPLPHLQLLLCPSTPSAMRRSKMRGEVRAAIAITSIGTNHKLLDQVNHQNQQLALSPPLNEGSDCVFFSGSWALILTRLGGSAGG